MKKENIIPIADGKWDFIPIPSGLTKREWFAGMALSGMCAAETHDHFYQNNETMANEAFNKADAMIKELEK